MTRRIAMQWNLRQVMASRAMYQTSELVPLLAERGVSLSREHVYRLVTRTPQRLNVEILAALCDILECEPNDLLQPVVETVKVAKTGTEPVRASARCARSGPRSAARTRGRERSGTPAADHVCPLRPGEAMHPTDPGGSGVQEL
jgi:DNA-binding Xre family transcriptional regulator